MNKNGFSLPELMISLAIMIIVLLMVSFTFQQVGKNVKSNNSEIQSIGDNLSATELFRIDLDHAGFGIPNFIDDITTNNEELPIQWDKDDRKLEILSTFSQTNSDTWGWAVGFCAGNTLSSALNPENISLNADDIKLVSTDSVYSTFLTQGMCLAYPHDKKTECSSSGSVNCTKIIYTLSASQNLVECADGTLNLLRNGSPLFTCVADFTTLFDWDSDGDGFIDNSEHNVAIPSSADTTLSIVNSLKSIQSYILVQVGKKDIGYNYGNVPNSSKQITLQIDGEDITFTTDVSINDFPSYHWEVIKISSAFRKK